LVKIPPKNLKNWLFLWEESEKIVLEKICRHPRFQVGRILLTMPLKQGFLKQTSQKTKNYPVGTFKNKFNLK
jgi:hypothetical protein